MLRMLLALCALSAIAGCSDSSGAASDAAGGAAGAAGAQAAAGEAGAGPVVPVSVELGKPGGEDDLDFLPLADGAELRLQTFGQGGTHVVIAVRCRGFGSRAFVSATLRNLVTGVEVEELAPARPQLLYCGEDDVCDLVPYLVHASGLTSTDDERDGLHALLTARARNESGAIAEGSVEVVLSTADL
jgi:hypothetical protein